MKTTHLLTLLLSSLLSFCAQAQVQINYLYDQNGNRVQRSKQPYTDLTPGLAVSPSTIYGTTAIRLRVTLTELSSLFDAPAPIRFRISKDSKLSLSFDPSATVFSGQPVQNANWSFDASSNSSYYVLSSNTPIAADSVITLGFTGIVTPGSSNGFLNISLTVLGITGEIALNNNIIGKRIEYFSQ